MRYKAKRDFVFVSPEGKKILVLQNDKVFVQQFGGKWDVYSVAKRNLIATLDVEELTDLFEPDNDKKKGPDRGRGSRNTLLALLILFSLPLGAIAQLDVVKWSWKAVRTDSNYFEFHLTADISRGWAMYKPNMPHLCEFSPIILFNRCEGVKAVGDVDALDAMLCDYEWKPNLSRCNIPLYKDITTFVQVFKLPIGKQGTIRGKIIYHAIARYMITGPKTVDFELTVSSPNETSPVKKVVEGNISTIKQHPRTYTIHPKGILRKTWWVIKHPFGPYYIRKYYVKE